MGQHHHKWCRKQFARREEMNAIVIASLYSLVTIKIYLARLGLRHTRFEGESSPAEE